MELLDWVNLKTSQTTVIVVVGDKILEFREKNCFRKS